MKSQSIIFLVAWLFLCSSMLWGQEYAWQKPEDLGYIPVDESFYSISFSSDSIGWAGGGYGILYKTTDKGRTWRKAYKLSGGTYSGIQQVEFVSPTCGWILDYNNHLISTINGGKTWDFTYHFPTDNIMEIHFTSATTGFALNLENGVYTTSDGGWTWKSCQLGKGGGFIDMFVLSDKEVWVLNDNTSKVYATTDGGKTWEERYHGAWSNPFAYMVKIHFTSPTKGWLGAGDAGLLMTNDGGYTWEKVDSTHLDLGYYDDIHFSDAAHGMLLSYGVYLTADSGRTWTKQQGISSHISWSDMDFSSPWEGCLVGSKTSIFTTSDGGQTVTPVMSTQTPSGSADWASKVFFASEQKGWIVGDEGGAIRTRDGGVTWQGMTYEYCNTLYSVHFATENHGWMVGDASTIRATTDGGNTWQTQDMVNTNEAFTDVFAISPEKAVITAYGGNLYTTSDGGATWQRNRITANQKLLDVSFVSPKTGWIVGTGGYVYATTDSGKTWVEHNIGANQSISEAAFVSETEGWAATTASDIWHTTDGGTTWEKQVSNAHHSLYGITFPAPDTGWAVGNSGAIVSTTDGGRTWVHDPQTVAGHNLRSVAFPSPKQGIAVGEAATLLLYAPVPVLPPDTSPVYRGFTEPMAYPNPFAAQLSVVLPTKHNITSAALYDIFGRELLRVPFTRNPIEMPVGELHNGLYFVQLFNGDALVKVLPVAKQD